MSQTTVEVRASRWLVVATSVGDVPEEWEFNDEKQAQWFAELVRRSWNARCPKCGYKEGVGLELWRSGDESLVAVAACGAWDDEELGACTFRQKFEYPAADHAIPRHPAECAQ